MKMTLLTAARTVPLLALTLVGLTCGWFAAPAAAHSELVASTPADGANLHSLPSRIELQFNQDIAAQFATVTLIATDTRADPITLDEAVAGATVTADVPGSLAPTASSWRVAYRVTSADGHAIEGAVDFVVARTDPSPGDRPSADEPDAGAAPTDTPAQSSSPDTSRTGGSPWSTTVLIGLVAGVGTATAIMLLRRGAREE